MRSESVYGCGGGRGDCADCREQVLGLLGQQTGGGGMLQGGFEALRAELTCGCVEAVTSPTSHEMLTLDETLSTGPPGSWCTVSPLRPSPEQSYPSFIRRLSEEILRGEAHQPPPHPGQRRRGGGVAKAAQK